MKSLIKEEHIKFVANKYPETKGDNTTFLIAYYETVCDSRKIPKSWENIKAIMNEYKPEAVTRKRRQFIKPTKEQREKEEEMRQEYSNKPNC